MTEDENFELGYRQGVAEVLDTIDEFDEVVLDNILRKHPEWKKHLDWYLGKE